MNYCPHCGALQTPQPITQWPHTCQTCKTEHFSSPKPVVALIINAWPNTPSPHPGTVLIQRGIEPHKGKWAFPGGYIDYQEDWRQAATREAREELGVALDQQDLHLIKVVTTQNTNYLVLFVGYSGDVLTTHDIHNDPKTKTKGEILDIKVATDKNIELGVPSHNSFWKIRHPP